MIKKKGIVIAIIATFCLTATLFMILPIRSNPSAGQYDPWADVNDDGKIDMYDIAYAARAFGTSGDTTKNVTIVPHPSINLWIYSAPFIVSHDIPTHPSPVGVGPGVYETDILVHNPRLVNVSIVKKVVEALPEPEQLTPRYFGEFMLLPDRAFRIDSSEILDVLGVTWPYFGIHKGYVAIISNSSDLDVVAFYTVSEVIVLKDMFASGNTTSIETLTISPKPYF